MNAFTALWCLAYMLHHCFLSSPHSLLPSPPYRKKMSNCYHPNVINFLASLVVKELSGMEKSWNFSQCHITIVVMYHHLHTTNTHGEYGSMHTHTWSFGSTIAKFQMFMHCSFDKET